jgi:1,4-alpha-glucan branching enzyme
MAKKTTDSSNGNGNGSGNGKRKEAFTIFAPSAGEVQLVGDFTKWEETPIKLKRSKDGTWKATVPLDPGVHEYRFLVDGKWINDPECPNTRPNAFGEQNCLREVK